MFNFKFLNLRLEEIVKAITHNLNPTRNVKNDDKIVQILKKLLEYYFQSYSFEPNSSCFLRKMVLVTERDQRKFPGVLRSSDFLKISSVFNIYE